MIKEKYTFKIISGQRRSFAGEKQTDVRKCTAKEVTFSWGLKKERTHWERKTFQKKEYRYMKTVRSIKGIVSLVQLKSEPVESVRNLDFMLNDNLLWGTEGKKETQFKEKWQGHREET